MGFLDALFDQRAIDISDWPVGDPLWNGTSDAGRTVTAQTANRLIAVRACIQLISGAIRTMPVDVVRKTDTSRVPVARPPRWVEYPNRGQTWGTFIGTVVVSLLKRGNGYVGVLSRDNLGYPLEIVAIHPDEVQVRVERGRKRIFVDGREVSEYGPYNPEGDVLHVLGVSDDGFVGLAPIEDAAQAIGQGLALEEHASRFFSNGASPTGTLELPAGSVPTPEQMASYKQQFNRKHTGLKNAHLPIVLGNGAHFNPITLPNDQAQFIESRKFSVEEIARLFGVPPFMIGDVERSTSWGSGIEQQGIGFVTYTLMPWLDQLQDAFSMFLPRGQYVRFDTKGLLRGDAAGRAAFYQSMAAMKAIEINEIRALEDMPPLDGGDQPPPAPNESI